MPDDWSVCGGIVETTAQKLWRILWGTASTPRWVWFLFGFGLAALLLTGCATMQAYQAEQARWQAKADQATRGLRASQVMVILKEGAEVVAHGAVPDDVAWRSRRWRFNRG
jgi:hypothetical protein